MNHSEKTLCSKGIKQFITKNGSVILVGRTSRENDKLTFELADKNDLWFHVKDYPGAHVVLKKPDSGFFNTLDIQTAANYAVGYSKASNLSKCEVSWCKVINVEKIPKSPPGEVVISCENIMKGFN